MKFIKHFYLNGENVCIKGITTRPNVYARMVNSKLTDKSQVLVWTWHSYKLILLMEHFQISLSSTSKSVPLWPENKVGRIFIFRKTIFFPLSMWCILGDVSCGLLQNTYSAVVGSSVLYMPVTGG